MESKAFNLSSLQNNTIEFDNTSSKISLGEVFTDNSRSNLNEVNLFIAHFNCIPNFIDEVGIDCRKANEWFIKTYQGEIKNVYFSKTSSHNIQDGKYEELYYFLFEDTLVYFNMIRSSIIFLFRKTDVCKVDKMIKDLRIFRNKKRRREPEISLLVPRDGGIGITRLKISKPRLSIDDNYNEDFKGIHQTILKRLSKKNDKGLILLHGKPGTGKTSYIRHLITCLKKNVIFLPPNMAGAITNPDLIAVLIENRNSIFVIEDAENIVVDREKDGRSPVSALLNISDGLLSDCLNIQIICSFNIDISKIDNALIRKGRLIAKYEFKELEVCKAQALSYKLGYETIINTPMTLTAIYNQEERDFHQTKSRNHIGFKAAIFH